MNEEPIHPGIVLPGGRVYYPTGVEWLIFFATAGCQWAIDRLKIMEEKGQQISRIKVEKELYKKEKTNDNIN